MLKYEISDIVEREVERRFKERPPIRGCVAYNPVTHSLYAGGIDPIKPQKEAAKRALLARALFAITGPVDAQPLPVSQRERDDVETRHGYSTSQYLFRHLLKRYSKSLENLQFDFDKHPSFAEYMRGVMWYADSPDWHDTLPFAAEGLAELKKRFPPKKLEGLNPRYFWDPPKSYSARKYN